jgi:hypothetical protein
MRDYLPIFVVGYKCVTTLKTMDNQIYEDLIPAFFFIHSGATLRPASF